MNPSRAELYQLEALGLRTELRGALRRMRRRHLWSLWVGLGRRVGAVTSPLVLGLVYLTLFAPFGLIGRLAPPARGWVLPRRTAVPDLDALRRQA